MLRINVPPNGPAKIDYSTFGNFLLPMPDGIDSEVSNFPARKKRLVMRSLPLLRKICL
jgi:hypothetical protein